MLKKGLIRTCIYQYLDKNPQINSPEKIFKNLKPIYEYLRNHPHHGDLLGQDCFPQFLEQARIGYIKAQRGQPSVFDELKKHFKM